MFVENIPASEIKAKDRLLLEDDVWRVVRQEYATSENVLIRAICSIDGFWSTFDFRRDALVSRIAY